jgi:hypothetical protein
LNEIFSEFYQRSQEELHEPLRIVVIGGDLEVHYLVQKIGQEFSIHPEKFLELEL